MNSRGQFWSLDIILAAAIFTLAFGLVLSSMELSVFYGQQERNTRELFSSAISGSNLLASSSDLWLQYTPAICDPFQGGNPNLCKDSTCQGAACNADVIDLMTAVFNSRCGPNFDFYLDNPSGACGIPPLPPCNGNPPKVKRSIHGWLSDNELSSLENCVVDYTSILRGVQFGMSPFVYMDMNARLADGNTIHFFMAKSKGEPIAIITRRMVIFPFPMEPNAKDLRECLDGNCGQFLTDLNLRVWRT